MQVEVDGVMRDVVRDGRIERVAAVTSTKGVKYRVKTYRDALGQPRAHEVVVEVAGVRAESYSFPKTKDCMWALDYVVELVGLPFKV